MIKLPSTLRKNEIVSFTVGLFVSAFAIAIYFHLTSLQQYDSGGSISIPMEEFPEPQWRTPATLAVRTITSTPFARFEIHKVKTGDKKVFEFNFSNNNDNIDADDDDQNNDNNGSSDDIDNHDNNDENNR
jgi:hypothetical protein